MTYRRIVNRLAPLESLPPEAFKADSLASQQLCDFFLALALILNDLKDTYIAHILLNDELPPDKPLTPELGQYGGLRVHVCRIQVGILDELLNLVRKQKRLLQTKLFLDLVSSLGDDARDHWRAIEALALGKKSKNPTARALALVRNRLSFHYDPDEIGRGYAACFFETDRVPLVSRGPSLASTRFYFADAAAEAYLFTTDDTENVREVLSNPKEGPLRNVTVAITNLIVAFVEKRGYQWESYATDSG